MIRKGPGGLTLRAMAAEVGISLGSLTSHYENRMRLLHLLCQVAGREWLRDVEERGGRHGPVGFLPRTPEDVVDTRVWLSWCELARSTPELTGTVRDVRLDERALLDDALRRHLAAPQLDRDVLDLGLAVVHGLRVAVCAPVEAMPVERASELLTSHLDALVERSEGAA
jgi:AcrR family transcriptional regulator